jgi:GNAT superfamily N-acetyltransferase
VIRLGAMLETAAAPLLWQGMEIHLAVASVLAGSTPGSVYVDDLEAPRSALLQTSSRFYLAGAPADAWLGSLRSFFLAEAEPGESKGREEEPGGFGVYYPDVGWQSAVEQILAGTDHGAGQCLYLEIDTTRAGRPPALPPGFRFRRLDGELLAEQTLGRRAELCQEMTSECPSVDFFLEHRFGICLETEGCLAGWCLSEYDVGDRCEVGIEVAPEHRRQGLGTAVALALAAEARSRGITRVGWHCYEGNRASVATALRAGFKSVLLYRAHGVSRSQHDLRGKT